MTGYLGAGAPYAIAHRGGAALAPENTLAAFERAYALGLRYFETDLRMTADGVCVAFHDARLQRVTGIRGRVVDWPWPALRTLRVKGVGVGDHHVARLEELLEAFPDARFVIDLKDPQVVHPLVRVLREMRAVDRVCLAGTTERTLAFARDLIGGGVTAAVGWDATARFIMAARTGNRLRPPTAARFLHVPFRLGGLGVFVDRLVGMAHDHDLRVLVWTVDQPTVMHRLLDAGVDGIFTDRPDLLREVLVARGSWRAPEPAQAVSETPVATLPDRAPRSPERAAAP